MTHYDLTVATRLIYQGRDYRFEQRRGDEIDWVHDRTNEHLVLTDEEIAELVANGSARLTCPASRSKGTTAPRPVPDLSNMSPEEIAELQRKWEYVQDLRRLAPRSPVKLQESTVLATARRISDPTAPTCRSVQRWNAEFGDRPHLGRVAARHHAKGNRADRLHPEVREIVERAIDQHYLRRPPIFIPTLQAIIHTEIRQVNEHRAEDDKLPKPGRDAISSAIGMRDKREVHAARHGEAAAAQLYNNVEHQKDPKAPLDLVELDHTVADLFVVTNGLRLPIGRPTIVFAIDRCTRMPFGFYITFEPPSILSVTQCLKNGILPKTYIKRKVEIGHWKIDNHWPVFGVPRALLLDRAMENLSHDIRLIAHGLGITRVRFAGRKDPKRKGAIERFFRTLNSRLLHEQRGTTFSNVVERDDYNPEKNAVITLDELYHQTHRFLVDIYAQKRHSGIRDVPARRWNELTRRFPVDALEDINEIRPLLGRGFKCSLSREGVRFKYIIYNSPELAAQLTSRAFLAKAGPKPRVEVRYDPADLGAVFVYLPHEERYLEVLPVPKWRAYADGLSLWEHLTILKFERARSDAAIEPDRLMEAMAGLVTQYETKDGRQRKSKTSKQLARFTGQARIAPAGDDYSTSPPGSIHSRRDRGVAASNDDGPRRAEPSNVTHFPGGRRRVRILKSPD